MARLEPVTIFIRDALVAGHSRSEVQADLAKAGWPDREIKRGLRAFDEQEFLPPVPRPQPRLLARETFIYAALFTALAVTATSLVNLVHAILDLRMPDPADEAYGFLYALDGARWAMAMLLVSTPIFVGMTEHARRRLKEDLGRPGSPVRKWLTYAALFVAGLVLLGDAVHTIYSFLQGDLTPRLLLKALTVAIVSGAVFAFYLSDLEDLGHA